ncbi:MAG: tRNA (adenosine(37)-N6)-threonylcarbamoyltransferase complex dimerization subunit type 1 TsaB [Crocinitomicaceae bacterium]
MAIILNLETATKTCSVSLASNGKVIATREEKEEHFSHAEKLNLLIQEVLALSQLSFHELDAVAVSAGPGSYTGLRIGTSTAKGICYALDIPLISINSLKALAALVKTEEKSLICPMFDARRMEVYTAVYDSQLQQIKPTEAKVIDTDSFHDLLKKNHIIFCGPGAVKCEGIIHSPHAYFDFDTQVSAAGMATLSEQKFNQNEVEDMAYFEPAYLKDFIAGKPKKLL